MQRMSDREYAAYSQILGPKAIKVNGIYWNQVRPFFFRPLLPFREYSPDSIFGPRSSIIGGIQFAVPTGVLANSFLNIRMYENVDVYSWKRLDRNRRRQVKLASEHFVIHLIKDVNDFKANAFPVYQSFEERTHYKTGAWRRDANGFMRWAEAIYKVPKIIVLGGYAGSVLKGVSVSMCVEDTMIFASTFCDTESLRWFLPDLMLHSVREIASNSPGIVQLFAGMSKDERGLDDFHVLRGCKLLRKPAVIHLSPWAKGLLRFGKPHLYAKMLGR